MSRSPLDSAPTAWLSLRRRRGIGIGALALVVIAAAGFAYLRSNATLPTKQTNGVPSTNPLQVTTSQTITYDFVTPSDGWAAENEVGPSGGAGQFRVFRTVDAARHWTLQLAGPSSLPGLTPLLVQFFDQKQGFMEVGLPMELYRTEDGGAHWQAVGLPTPRAFAITFSDLNHGWSLAGPNGLYATVDGGYTWQNLPDPPADAYYISGGSLAFRRPTEGWMGSVGPGPPHVYASTDMGLTWQRHDLPPPPGRIWDTSGSGTTVQLLPQIGTVATTESGVTGSSEIDLFTSFDTGTWRFVPPPPGYISYQDAFHWWAIKGRVLSKSSDAGQTWVQISHTLPDWQILPDILDSKHAWSVIVARGFGLALTSDGGLHWTRANVPQLQ
jgi:photosystem II stability/assembly factor-like uncharacterized protein